MKQSFGWYMAGVIAGFVALVTFVVLFVATIIHQGFLLMETRKNFTFQNLSVTDVLLAMIFSLLFFITWLWCIKDK